MSFANPLPWWALCLIVAAAGLIAWLAYNRRTLPPLRRRVLVTLRFITLLALIVFRTLSQRSLDYRCATTS